MIPEYGNPFETCDCDDLQGCITKVDFLFLDLEHEIQNITSRLDFLQVKNRLLEYRINLEKFRIGVLEDHPEKSGMAIPILFLIMVFLFFLLFRQRRQMHKLSDQICKVAEAEGRDGEE